MLAMDGVILSTRCLDDLDAAFVAGGGELVGNPLACHSASPTREAIVRIDIPIPEGETPFESCDHMYAFGCPACCRNSEMVRARSCDNASREGVEGLFLFAA